jgi:hypothetical protein
MKTKMNFEFTSAILHNHLMTPLSKTIQLGIFWLTFGGIFLICGGYFVMRSITYYQCKKSTTWPTTSAKIIASFARSEAFDRGSGKVNYLQTALVNYVYQVGETEYEGDRIFWSNENRVIAAVHEYPIGNSQEKKEGHHRWVDQDSSAPNLSPTVKALLTQYPLNGTVSVHYNPEKPDESVLKPTFKFLPEDIWVLFR